MSIDRWMDKEMGFINKMEYYSTIKKAWNNAICSNMDWPRDYHTKWSKSDKRKTNISYHSYMKSNCKKWYKWTYLQKRNRLTHIENKLMVTKGETW